MINDHLSKALSEWGELLGEKGCLHDKPTLKTRSTATFAGAPMAVAWLCPTTVEDVVACVRVANHYAVPLYPVSRGQNWGLGSKAPAAAGCAVLDLAHLNRIDDFDPKLGTVRVEPGVTFRQLYEFLKNENSDFYSPAIGGPEGASVLANALERGDGIGPGGDRFAQVHDLDVILADASRISTGFGRFANTPLGALHPYGVGPLIDGLFSQSNLGIVLSATLHLTPKPDQVTALMFKVGDDKALAAFAEVVRPMVRQGVIGTHALSLWNGYKVAAREKTFSQIPEAERSHDTLGQWWGSILVYAESSGVMAERLNLLQQTLRDVVHDVQIGSNRTPNGKEIETPFTGEPEGRNVRSVYWHKDAIPDRYPTPEADNCGVLWLCVAVPFTGEDLSQATGLMTRNALDAGFEPNIGLHAVSFRCFHAFLALMYDRNEPGADARAQACHDAAAKALINASYLPNRLGIQSMDILPPACDDSPALIKTLKEALDPKGIIAPGRYDRLSGK